MRIYRGTRLFWITVCINVLLLPLLLNYPVHAQTPPPIAGTINLPDGYQAEPLDLQQLPAASIQSTGLKAVVIVGDIGEPLPDVKADMDTAVAALEAHGVTVAKFYYGDSEFDWADIVAAADGIHFLLYMGHGVFNGNCKTPASVGGFYLGDNKFVPPGLIRSGLKDRMAADSVIILSHACYAAGGPTCGDQDTISLEESERRVKQYASPFIDLGVQAYYANNYYGSAASIINYMLEDPDTRQNVGGIFRSVYPYQESEFHDLSYPEDGYDLWLSGVPEDGAWDDAFVGIPEYTFAGDSVAALGGLPDTLTFTYYKESGLLIGSNQQLTPQNVGNDDTLQWEVMGDSTWLTVSPLQGTTPQTFTVNPADFSITQEITYTGRITVTVTSPSTVEGSPYPVSVTLRVVDGSHYEVFLPAIMRGY